MYCIILVTVKDCDEAEAISRKLLEQKRIACSNIIKDVASFFLWQGKLDKAKEVLMILKAREKDFKEIAREIKNMHSYDTPEIIALPIICGDKDYLDWIDEVTKKGKA